jgi:hypothetical protein
MTLIDGELTELRSNEFGLDTIICKGTFLLYILKELLKKAIRLGLGNRNQDYNNAVSLTLRSSFVITTHF